MIRICFGFFHGGWIELAELHKKKCVPHLKTNFRKKIPKVRVLGRFPIIYEDYGVVDIFEGVKVLFFIVPSVQLIFVTY